MRKIIIIYTVIIIISAFGFSKTNGLIAEVINREQHVVVYCDELMSSGNDDDLIITFFSVVIFLCIFLIGLLPERWGKIIKLIPITLLCGFQILLVLGAIEAGSFLVTLSYDKNMFLFFWTIGIFSFIPVVIGYSILSVITTHQRKKGHVV